MTDPDLQAWLAALPEALKGINPQNPNAVDDGEGEQVDVGHKVWIEGPGSSTWGVPPVDEQHPLTITGEYGCGKIMFTAYHTAENGKYIGLTPQELVLMYLILDIGVCQEPYDVPPVP